MATYLKRTSKLFDLSLSRPSADVSLRDLMCPVCRGILIEPVTLPCTHNLCLRCLKGTFEHNSLSCPLCRVRVGSWLRTATKSETLVNNGLWELIRTKFPKEVEDKHNGDDRDLELDAGFTAANKILSAAGEIRREYEAQLQMAEEEMRRQREVEQIASEALIRKLQVEEQQQQLAQLAQDQLLAKTLARKQVVEKQKEMTKCYNECLSTAVPNCSFDTAKFNIKSMSMSDMGTSNKLESSGLESGKMNLSEIKDGSELRRSNIALISKIRAERYASSMKANAASIYKDSAAKFCCQKPMPVYNVITRTLKHQAVTKFTQPCTSNYSADPGSSTSKIYGTQTKEELHIPNDVVNSKKKSLGVEVCMTSGEDDERIGSAESAGSHDSINQEIHHFKPIKAMPRTPLKISSDGKQIDPKLIRVVPILKRIPNAVPKPPSPTHLKRIIGCSWSAFRGKARQDSKVKESCSNKEDTEETEQKPSTSLSQSQSISQKAKAQTHDAIRRLDFVPELSFDSNKNYAKSVNRIINGTKVSKKLTLDEHVDSRKIHKSWKTHVRNGMVGKCKRQRNLWTNKKDVITMDTKEDAEEDARDSASSASAKVTPHEEQQEECTDDAAVENIAERIKRRKVNADKKSLQRVNPRTESEAETTKRNTRKRISSVRREDESPDDGTTSAQKRIKKKLIRKVMPRAKRQRTCKTAQLDADAESENLENSPVEMSCETTDMVLRKSTRNVKTRKGTTRINDQNGKDNRYNNSPDSCDETQDRLSVGNENVKNDFTVDDDVIKEQERMERLVIQEKEDFELAQRLQAKFDEMERIAGRTRRSRKAIESGNMEVDLYKIEVGRTVQRTTGANTAKQSTTVNQTTSSETTKKRRGRPPKRVK